MMKTKTIKANGIPARDALEEQLFPYHCYCQCGATWRDSKRPVYCGRCGRPVKSEYRAPYGILVDYGDV